MSQTIESRFWNKVEKTDSCWNWIASVTPGGYGKILYRGKLVASHRLSYEWANGQIPQGMLVDHMCFNRRCVRPDHLRLATQKQNLENRSSNQSNNKSGVRGVYWDKRTKSWCAGVQHSMKSHYCGRYPTLAEAEAAVIAKRNELFTHNILDRKEAA